MSFCYISKAKAFLINLCLEPPRIYPLYPCGSEISKIFFLFFSLIYLKGLRLFDLFCLRLRVTLRIVALFLPSVYSTLSPCFARRVRAQRAGSARKCRQVRSVAGKLTCFFRRWNWSRSGGDRLSAERKRKVRDFGASCWLCRPKSEVA